MTANQTLISADEVVKFGPAHSEFDPQLFAPYIVLQEEKAFRVCIGMEIYKALFADEVDYSASPAYDSQAAYAQGDTVFYNRRYFQATKAAPAGKEPLQEYYWVEAPKFNKAEYNFLWERYLRPLLAWFVTHTAIIHIANRIKSRGILKPTGGGTGPGASPEAPSSLQEVVALKNAIGDDSWDLWSAMDYYIRENKASFAGYLPIDNKCDCTCFGVHNNQKYYGFNIGE